MGGYGLGNLSADFELPDATSVTRAIEILQGVKDSLSNLGFSYGTEA